MAALFGLARIGRDVETRKTAQQESVANVSLAFNYGRKDAATNRRPTQWVEGVLWGARADALAPYLLKGQSVAVTVDEIHIEEYTTKDGVVVPKLTGRITAIDLAGGALQQQSAARTAASAAPPPRRAAAPAAATAGGYDDPFDDVPF